MKIKTGSKPHEGKWEPIKLEVTFETEKELASFWLQLNTNSPAILRENKVHFDEGKELTMHSLYSLWDTVDELILAMEPTKDSIAWLRPFVVKEEAKVA